MNKLINEQHKNMLFVNKKTWARIEYSSKVDRKYFRKLRHHIKVYDKWIPKMFVIYFDKKGEMFMEKIEEKA